MKETGALRHVTSRIRGHTLIELMIALVISMFIATGVALLFISVHKNRNELEKSNRQVENGRFALETLSQDIRLAGFFGLKSFSCEEIYGNSTCTSPGTITSTNSTHAVMWYRVDMTDAAAVPLPNICESNPLNWLKSTASTPDYTHFTTNYMLWPIQAYNNRTAFPQAGCFAALPAVYSGIGGGGTDVLVIRRQSTDAINTAAMIDNQPYVQTGAAPDDKNKTITLKVGQRNDGTTFDLQRVSGAVYATTSVHRLVSHIYFISPCSYGTGANGACQVGDDTIPTLKMIELVAGTSGPVFQLVNIAEGIEDINYEFGIDNDRDGSADVYLESPDRLDWFNLVSIRINLVARNTEASGTNIEQKTFNLGLGKTSVTPADTTFKRHLYTQTVRVTNPSMRRE